MSKVSCTASRAVRFPYIKEQGHEGREAYWAKDAWNAKKTPSLFNELACDRSSQGGQKKHRVKLAYQNAWPYICNPVSEDAEAASEKTKFILIFRLANRRQFLLLQPVRKDGGKRRGRQAQGNFFDIFLDKTDRVSYLCVPFVEMGEGKRRESRKARCSMPGRAVGHKGTATVDKDASPPVPARFAGARFFE